MPFASHCLLFLLLAEQEGGGEAVVTPPLPPPTWGLPPSWLSAGLARAPTAPLAQWLPWGPDVGVPLGALLSFHVPVSGLRLLSILLGLEDASLSSPGTPAPAPGGRPPARPGRQPQEEQHVHQVGWASSPAAEWESGAGAAVPKGLAVVGRACQPGKVRGPHSPPHSWHRPAGLVMRPAAAAHPRWWAGLRCPDGPARRRVRGSASGPGGRKAGAGGRRRAQGQSRGSPPR